MATSVMTVLLLVTCSPDEPPLEEPYDPGKGDQCGNPEAQTIQLKPLMSGFRLPTAVLQPPDDAASFFIVEKAGRILRVRRTGDNFSTPTVFADLTDRVNSLGGDFGSEAGLLGMAFHPDFRNNGLVFLSYTGFGNNASELQSRVSRFRATPTQLEASSEQVLLTLEQPFLNHNGGSLGFGPVEGGKHFLYAGFGDGGSQRDPLRNGQNPDVLFSKILRIDVDAIQGGAPITRPGGPVEIFATGLRNPWRFSFDSATGEMWLGDVGQDEIEEINKVVDGGNYGWSCRAGSTTNTERINSDQCATGMISPVTTTSHADNDISITGGYVYHGTEIKALQGQYIFADVGSTRIFALSFTNVPGEPRVRNAEQRVLRVGNSGQSGRNIVAFWEDVVSGELYVVDHSLGRVFQIVAGACTDGSGGGGDGRLYNFLAIDGIGSEREGNEYYELVAPEFKPGQTTLAEWERAHGLDRETNTFRSLYQNKMDLGFWREMACTKTIGRGQGGCRVRNWNDEADPTTPGKKNLGTVCMDVTADGITRFFVFDPDGILTPTAVLDAEGEKFAPQLCTPCHSGQYKGPNSDGDLGSIFREFEPSLLAKRSGITQAAAELEWFNLNEAIRKANKAIRSQAEGGPAGIDAAKANMESYVVDIYAQTSPPTSRPITDPFHIPPSWRRQTGESAALGEAKAKLWTELVNPWCMGCHRNNRVLFFDYAEFRQLGAPSGNTTVLEKLIDATETPPTGGNIPKYMPQSQLMFRNLKGASGTPAHDAIDLWKAASP
jgi:glucose/arabinose dehydrogenase